ncbi:hypothetical protein GGI20_004815 [Coemansia sp. BCRC 34301]|nr:hypothetical protein GGI20_004815 [Coemansia sp. BCRC 34301]
MEEAQTPTSPNARYGLRTRTPAKPTTAEPSGLEEVLATPRKRGRPAASTHHSNKLAILPSTPTRGRGRGRGRGGRSAARVAGSDEGDESQPDAAEMSSEDDEYAPAETNVSLLGVRRGVHDLAPLVVDTPVRTGRRGRPRKSLGVAGTTAPRHRTGIQALSELVGDMALVTPAKRSWEVRRIPVHLSKHDAFRAEQLDDALRIMQAVPVGDADDRYEMKKMSDAVKMCGYELQPSLPALDEVYRLLAWAVHPPPQSSATPEVSEEARALVLRVFADVGRRIRSETNDLASYHRRHVLRKLLLAENVGQSPSVAEHAEDDEVKSPKSELAVHRRNPLRVPGPLIDIWKLPPSLKKPGAAAGDDHHESDL